jgi:hypothetical protein
MRVFEALFKVLNRVVQNVILVRPTGRSAPRWCTLDAVLIKIMRREHDGNRRTQMVLFHTRTTPVLY